MAPIPTRCSLVGQPTIQAFSSCLTACLFLLPDCPPDHHPNVTNRGVASLSFSARVRPHVSRENRAQGRWKGWVPRIPRESPTAIGSPLPRITQHGSFPEFIEKLGGIFHGLCRMILCRSWSGKAIIFSPPLIVAMCIAALS